MGESGGCGDIRVIPESVVCILLKLVEGAIRSLREVEDVLSVLLFSPLVHVPLFTVSIKSITDPSVELNSHKPITGANLAEVWSLSVC